ncbi:MAG: CopG family transcriptional regulator [Chloroflexi bacterium]|nr:CopG family transcriptional regulator [Chloroflexota bacterium]
MADLEKITINMSVVDLGQIDLLVEEGFYSNRADFIRTAIRNQLTQHSDAVKQSLTRKTTALGVIDYSQRDLEGFRAVGEMVEIRVVGMLQLNDDITPELAQATIKSIKVFGVLRASEALKQALADRLKN